MIYICIAIGFANIGADIAEMKGHGRSPWWAWCFWWGIAGMVIVAALPDRNPPAPHLSESRSAAVAHVTSTSDELPDL